MVLFIAIFNCCLIAWVSCFSYSLEGKSCLCLSECVSWFLGRLYWLYCVSLCLSECLVSLSRRWLRVFFAWVSHPLGVKRGFIKGEALRLLRTNSSETTFEESISNFISCLITRGYPHKMIQTTLSEVNFAKRQSALQQKKKTRKQILPFVTTYHPSVRNLKNILMQNWNLIQNQPLLKSIFKDLPIISYKRGQSLEDMLIRAKI